MFKLLSLNLVLVLPAVAMQNEMTQVDSVVAPKALGEIALYHSNKNGFIIKRNNEEHPINNAWLDPDLRTFKKDQLESFQKVGYFQVKQLDNGEFKLLAHVRGNGGGVGGATAGFWVGRTAVYLVAYGTIYAIAAASGPAAPAVGAALTAAWGPGIEAASNVVACGTAIAGATITGPV
jgi:hypothetical protein